MKKALLVMGVLLVALSVMAPGPPDKAEKLRFDDNNWDRQWSYYDDPDSIIGIFYLDVKMSSKFGVATAAEHSGQFKVSLFLSGKYIDNSHWDTTTSEVEIIKTGTPKDEYGFFELVTQTVEWNGDDDGSHIVIDYIALNLISPSGNMVSSTPLRLETPFKVCPSTSGCVGVPALEPHNRDIEAMK